MPRWRIVTMVAQFDSSQWRTIESDQLANGRHWEGGITSSARNELAAPTTMIEVTRVRAASLATLTPGRIAQAPDAKCRSFASRHFTAIPHGDRTSMRGPEVAVVRSRPQRAALAYDNLRIEFEHFWSCVSCIRSPDLSGIPLFHGWRYLSSTGSVRMMRRYSRQTQSRAQGASKH